MKTIKFDTLNISELKKLLKFNDPNGIYGDKESIDEGMKPLEKEEAVEILMRQCEYDEEELNKLYLKFKSK